MAEDSASYKLDAARMNPRRLEMTATTPLSAENRTFAALWEDVDLVDAEVDVADDEDVEGL